MILQSIHMQEAFSLLQTFIFHSAKLSEEEWQAFASIWKICNFRRKEIITTPGQIEKNLYFVVEGVQRVYYFDHQDREATLVFTYAPSFGGVLDALMLQQPSRYYYETLTASTFLKASYSDLERLMMQHRGIENMVRAGITQALSGVLERLVELQCYSSEDKFKKLMHRSPHILQLVPHKYLANYIGIDPTNFSKMVNKIKI